MLNEKKETVLYKKLIFSILFVALLNLLGCYSNQILYPDQYQEIMAAGSKTDEIIIKLRNGEGYKFARGYYHIKNDTLTGEGFAITNDIEEPYKGSIPLSQIGSIHFDEMDSEKTFLLWSLAGAALGAILLAVALANFEGDFSSN